MQIVLLSKSVVLSTMKSTTFCLFIGVICCITQAINAGNTYKAAVVEFSPDTDIPQSIKRISKNTKSFIDFIEQAAQQYADIIVFPEFGLTSWADLTNETVGQLSTEVPDASSQITPCQSTNPEYSKHLKDLSCSAALYKIYTAVNLIERQYDKNTKKAIYYNTNVVFNREGAVIAKYRKINLFNEPVFAPGNELVTFKTDFGVTFGMFICFDIMFKYPALDVLGNGEITDIVYSVAWFSELPFYQALSVQHGYAKSKGINLLVSGMNSPSTKNGGSGIYLYSGDIAQNYISGLKESRLIIADVPKVSKPNSPYICETSRDDSGRGIKLPGSLEGRLSDINSFVTSQENLVNYTTKIVTLDKEVVSERICSGTDFCCSFDMTVKRDKDVALNYVYKLIAFYGVSQISMTRSLGLRNCALVACLDESDDSCGGRRKEPPQGVVFENILVKGNFDPSTTHAQPDTVTHDLVTIPECRYCRKGDDGSVEVELKTNKKPYSILVFGIHGRVFNNDDKPAGPITDTSS